MRRLLTILIVFSSGCILGARANLGLTTDLDGKVGVMLQVAPVIGAGGDAGKSRNFIVLAPAFGTGVLTSGTPFIAVDLGGIGFDHHHADRWGLVMAAHLRYEVFWPDEGAIARVGPGLSASWLRILSGPVAPEEGFYHDLGGHFAANVVWQTGPSRDVTATFFAGATYQFFSYAKVHLSQSAPASSPRPASAEP